MRIIISRRGGAPRWVVPACWCFSVRRRYYSDRALNASLPTCSPTTKPVSKVASDMAASAWSELVHLLLTRCPCLWAPGTVGWNQLTCPRGAWPPTESWCGAWRRVRRLLASLQHHSDSGQTGCRRGLFTVYDRRSPRPCTTIESALSTTARFGLTANDARTVVAEMRAKVASLRDEFNVAGVTAHDMLLFEPSFGPR